MWLTKPKMIVLEIPKCGSTSLHKTAQVRYGKRYIKHHGHKTCDVILALLREEYPKRGEVLEYPLPVLGVVRNPYSRFVSQVHNYMAIKGAKLGEALEAAAKQSHIIFKPQVDFLPTDPKLASLVLYPIKDMVKAQSLIAGTVVSPIHYNQSNPRFDIATLQSHIMYRAAIQHYERDIALYHKVKNGEYYADYI